MTDPKNTIYNLDEIKKQAHQSIMDGAVTMDYELDPKVVCKVLNEALATEIMCVLRYRHHQIIAKGINAPQVAAEFAEHAEDEHEHMMWIAERISQLGGNPDFNPSTVPQRTATSYSLASDLVKLIEEDLIAERIAIMFYRKLIDWLGTKDSTTRRLIEKILKDEEDHADDLSNFLS